MRVLVCGSRTFRDSLVVETFLFGYQWLCKGNDAEFVVIEGGAKGADSLAAFWAQRYRRNGVGHEPFPADWDNCAPECDRIHRRRNPSGRLYCPTAGHRRNQRMLDEGKPDLVVAFLDKPEAESRGTHDMLDRARRAGVKWVIVQV